MDGYGSRHLLDTFPIVFNFLSKQHLVIRCAVAMSVELEVHTFCGQMCYFLRIHELQNTFRNQFVVINIQQLRQPGRNFICLLSVELVSPGILNQLPLDQKTA